MYKARLRTAAAFIRTIDPEKFNMYFFHKIHPECGFVGCAVGHMAHKKIFPGLNKRPHGISYKGFSNMNAVAKLFGLKRSQAVYLFGPGWEDHERLTAVATPAAVAKRIERFIAKPRQPGALRLAYLDGVNVVGAGRA